MVLNIYKEKNWTSFDVVARVRGILGEKKVGHAGTLDPLAEGVLIVLTGKDTKRQSEFMKMKKEYIAEIGFGLESDTYDLESDVRLRALYPLNFKESISKYVGKIKQRVPPYSAVKVKGQRLYKKARSGDIKESELPVKGIEIYKIDVLGESTRKVRDWQVPVMKIRIVCSSGTYVRALANDLGGVLLNLTRTRVGDYLIDNSVKVSDLTKEKD